MSNINNKTRLKIKIEGAVQGVGFRPFIYRIATELNLNGWVNNSSEGVFIEVEGSRENLEQFLSKINTEKPAISIINNLNYKYLAPLNYSKFEIKKSVSGAKTAIVLPEIATCNDCIQDIFNPKNRRFEYPFTNCTNCGPRYTIINSLPYDRNNTTMSNFTMCSDCQKEYENPLNRRFHAQPNACSKCGPHLELWDVSGNLISSHNSALKLTVNAIKNGQIVAIKGLGGFHLVADASNNDAVTTLRHRKHRPDKPFALMFPNMETVNNHCQVSDLEKQLLLSPQAPIVLLFCHNRGHIAESISPNNPYLGVMLPYTPLHHLLMKKLGFPIIATSANLADEPICIDENEALIRLKDIADLFLIHNRPIVRAVDDSIVRVVGDRPLILRRARGYAPLPTLTNYDFPPMLAVGGHFKNTIAIAQHNQVFLSQHIGDLATTQSLQAFEEAIAKLSSIYDLKPDSVVCDLHPDYISSQWAAKLNLPLTRVQHHKAHVFACIADNDIKPPVLGVAWDGTGYGEDGTIWGGEFFLVTDTDCPRVAHLRQFSQPGGEKAVKEPRRSAMGILYEIFGDELFRSPPPPLRSGVVRTYLAPFKDMSASAGQIYQKMLNNGINTPKTSSIGRFFDGVVSLLGIRQQVSFEGQGAMELEFLLRNNINQKYSFIIRDTNPLIVDFEPIILGILDDIKINLDRSIISAKFHNTLADIIVEIAQKIAIKQVLLTGGCFQNKYLTERTILSLKQANFTPFWHKNIPPNDGGIALGQIIINNR